MSFAYDSKLEVLKEEITSDCCAIAFLSAIIKCSGQLNISERKYVVEIFTEIEELYEKVNAIIDELKADGTLDKLAEKYELNLAL